MLYKFDNFLDGQKHLEQKKEAERIRQENKYNDGAMDTREHDEGADDVDANELFRVRLNIRYAGLSLKEDFLWNPLSTPADIMVRALWCCAVVPAGIVMRIIYFVCIRAYHRNLPTVYVGICIWVATGQP